MKNMINVALPKGRLGKKVYKMFEEAVTIVQSFWRIIVS